MASLRNVLTMRFVPERTELGPLALLTSSLYLRILEIESHCQLPGAVSTESLWQCGRQYAKGAGVANV